MPLNSEIKACFNFGVRQEGINLVVFHFRFEIFGSMVTNIYLYTYYFVHRNNRFGFTCNLPFFVLFILIDSESNVSVFGWLFYRFVVERKVRKSSDTPH